MARSTDERPRTAYLAPGSLDRAVADAREGDAAAFRLLYQEFQPPLLRYLRFLAGDRAEDVAERAWQGAAAEGLGARSEGTFLSRWIVRAWGRQDDGYAAFRCWLAGRARELALGGPETLAGPGAPGGPDPDDATAHALRLITSLPPEEAEAVLLRSVLGLDARRAARVCGRRPGRVRAAARRGLSALAGRV